MEIKSLFYHCNINVTNLERSIAFYEQALGLKEVKRKEAADGSVRGNLRSKADWDISGVARELGGGGHKAAAGFTAKGSVDEVLSLALPKLHALIDID